MAENTIGFIGGGNMACSLIGGLIADGCIPQHIWVSEPQPERRAALQQQFGIRTTASNPETAAASQTLVLAVKPQMMATVVKEVAAVVAANRPLIVSIAAGVRETAIRAWLGYDASIVRAMPNTPALVRTGATTLYANPHVNSDEENRAESVLRSVGITLWLSDEALLDAVTALSGSGPAYLFLVMEIMEGAARKMGLPAETARLLTLQTAFGTAKMALESEYDVAALRAQVTSPGGTTERAIDVLERGGLADLFTAALVAARNRAQELGHTLEET
jgi:pyrroline-5-carboxylate reductase